MPVRISHLTVQIRTAARTLGKAPKGFIFVKIRHCRLLERTVRLSSSHVMLFLKSYVLILMFFRLLFLRVLFETCWRTETRIWVVERSELSWSHGWGNIFDVYSVRGGLQNVSSTIFGFGMEPQVEVPRSWSWPPHLPRRGGGQSRGPGRTWRPGRGWRTTGSEPSSVPAPCTSLGRSHGTQVTFQ
jgi:hypothetical protein